MATRGQRDGIRRAMGPVGGGLLGLALGCVDIGAFACERDMQCELDGVVGRCFDPGHCALPDDRCESGYRFHEASAPEEIAGRCAPPPEPEGSSTDAASTSGPMRGSESGETSTTGGSSEEGSSSTGSACGDRPCGCTASLAVGLEYSCAARFDGRVVCWGTNYFGELGANNITEPIAEPVLVTIPDDLPVSALSEGNNHTCARATDDSVACWGRNINGEIAPNLRNPLLGPTPLVLDEPTGAIALAPQHTCVGSSAGPSVRCQGNNTYDKLGGNGPDPIDGTIPGMQPIEQMSLGRDHSCAMAGGRVWCWGRNNQGQLGDPMVDGFSETPVEVSLPGDATLIGGGRDHTCVVIDAGNDVLCWGRNSVGQIGDGTNNRAEVPTPLAAPLPAPVLSLDGRLDTTCALLDDDDVFCWGGINGVEIGTAIEPGMELTEPMRIEVIDELPEPVVEVDVGEHHLCARAESGRLWCWGFDDKEQLGPSDPPDGQVAVEIDVACPDGVGS